MRHSHLFALLVISCGDTFTAARFSDVEAGAGGHAGSPERAGGASSTGGRAELESGLPDAETPPADARMAEVSSSPVDAGRDATRDAMGDSGRPGAGGQTGGGAGGKMPGAGGSGSGGIGSGGAGTGGAPCQPKSCEAQGIECGSAEDLCGSPLHCGACTNKRCDQGTCVCDPSYCPFCVGTACCKPTGECGCSFAGACS